MFYIDKDFKCHATNPNGEYREINKSIFQNKCNDFIEGYRYIPYGENWTREDGIIFTGEMITPWKNYSELDLIQRKYEKQLLEKTQNELAELDAYILETQYQSLIGGL